MTDSEILLKAINKAIINGYQIDKNAPLLTMPDIIDLWLNGDIYFIIIFSQSFAKAFWGEWESQDKMWIETHSTEVCEYLINDGLGKWQYHLQQMVLEENPIKYLEKFL